MASMATPDGMALERMAHLSTKGGVTHVTLKVLVARLDTAGKKPVDKRSATGLFVLETNGNHRILS